MIARSPEPACSTYKVSYAVTNPMAPTVLGPPLACHRNAATVAVTPTPTSMRQSQNPPRAVPSFAYDGLQPPGDLSPFSAQPTDTRSPNGERCLSYKTLRFASVHFSSPTRLACTNSLNIPLRSTRRLTTTCQRHLLQSHSALLERLNKQPSVQYLRLEHRSSFSHY